MQPLYFADPNSLQILDLGDRGSGFRNSKSAILATVRVVHSRGIKFQLFCHCQDLNLLPSDPEIFIMVVWSPMTPLLVTWKSLQSKSLSETDCHKCREMQIDQKMLQFDWKLKCTYSPLLSTHLKFGQSAPASKWHKLCWSCKNMNRRC